MRRDGAFVVVLTTLASLWSPLRGAERAVSCLLRSPCVLPCPFDPGPEAVIHWLKPPDDKYSVHSFYHGSDRLDLQQPKYRGRTALFKDQISKGNASLLMTGIELADRGRYKCYTSTTKGNNEDFVNVDVKAPVRDVLLEEDGQKLKCVSTDIFPKPSVTWSPHCDHSTSVTEPHPGLFSVLSSVPLTQRPPLEYSCNVSTEHSWRSATYRRTDRVTSSGSKTVVPCVETETSIKSLVWTFNRTQNILQRTGSNTVYGPDWESRLEQVPGSELVLKDLSLDQQGLYTCVLTTDSSTYLTVTEVTVARAEKAAGASTGLIVGVVLGVILVVAAVGVVLWWHFKKKKVLGGTLMHPKQPVTDECTDRPTDGRTQPLIEMQNGNPNNTNGNGKNHAENVSLRGDADDALHESSE